MRTRNVMAMLIALLVMGSLLPAGAAPIDPNGTFIDDDSSIFEPDIEAIADVGVTRGCNPPANDAYCPDGPVTRAQMASFLVRALRLTGPVVPSTVDAFVDDDDSIHEANINTIAELGITAGCTAPGLANPSIDPVAPADFDREIALLTDVDVERMTGFDRLTFTFENALPDYGIAYGTFPVRDDPSDEIIPLDGDNFFTVTMAPASGFDLSTATPRVTYPGPYRLSPRYPSVQEVVVSGDFEAVMSYSVGVDYLPGWEVTTATSPFRLIVDVNHPATFCPNDPVTRGQMAAFLTRAFDFVDDDPADRFVDDDTSIFESDIEAIAAAGVTFGCNPPDYDRFCPNDPVTRGQMAAFLTRALGLTRLAPPSVAEADLVRPVFFFDQPSGGPYLGTVARYVADGEATPEAALTALLGGPTDAEMAMSPAFSTAIPDGVDVLSFGIAGSTATVDLSGEFLDDFDPDALIDRQAQVVFTLSAYPTVDLVEITVEGVAPSAHTPESFFDSGVLPEIFPHAPAAFEFVESPFEVTGWSRAFEATVNWELYDNDGVLIAEGFETTGAGGPDFGPMSFEVAYDVDRRQVGSLMVFEISAKDGSRIHLREVPLWLEP